jgi:hypothetical protein
MRQRSPSSHCHGSTGSAVTSDRSSDIYTMDEETELLRSCQLFIDPAAHVLVCFRPQCLFGLSSKVGQVGDHLNRRHAVPNDVRSRIAKLLRRREPALQHPSDAPLRPDRSEPDPSLRKFEGFACKFCDYRTIAKQNTSRHIADRHEQERERLDVRPLAMFLPVYLQAWTRNPPESRYWVVCEDGNDKTRPVGSQETFDHLEDLHRRERRRNQGIADDGAAATLNAKPAYPELRPWLERTEWEVTYQDVHRVFLRTLTGIPSKPPFSRSLLLGRAGTGDGRARLGQDVVISADDEQRIAVLSMAAMSVMERCEHTARTTGRNLLCWLRSLRPNATYSKPFTFVSHASSRMKYYALLKRFLAMVFRAYRIPIQVRRRTAGIRFKKAQLDLIEAIWNHEVWKEDDAMTPGFWGQAHKFGGPSTAQGLGSCSDGVAGFEDDLSDVGSVCEDDEDEDVEDDGYEDGEADDRDEIAEVSAFPSGDMLKTQAVEALELLFGLIMEFCTEEVTDGRPASTLLVYFSGILGFLPDCTGFLPAKSYTPHLAGLMYIQRLLFLEYALPARGYPLLAISQRPRRDQIARLQAVRQTYAVVGAQSPFDELSSLMAYLLTLVFSPGTRRAPRIRTPHWSNLLPPAHFPTSRFPGMSTRYHFSFP